MVSGETISILMIFKVFCMFLCLYGFMVWWFDGSKCAHIKTSFEGRLELETTQARNPMDERNPLMYATDLIR